MDKIEFMIILIDSGYDASIEDNVLKIKMTVKSQRELDRKVKEIDKMRKDNGYNGSIGWKVVFDE